MPSSKSYANRALILAAQSHHPIIINNVPSASDVSNLICCLVKIGLKITQNDDRLIIENSFPACERSEIQDEIYVGEGGTTARFLAALLLLGRNQYVLRLGNRLKMRPWTEFLDLVKELGGKAHLNDSRLVLQGPLVLPDILHIDCAKTTQFATAFQLLRLSTGTSVKPLNLSTSQSYWSMTEKLVEDFKGVTAYDVPLDWSSASYPMAYAALNHEIVFPGLFPDPWQADSKFYDILSSFDCIKQTDEGLTVKPFTEHRSVKLDVSDCLDLVPTLSYFLAHVEGKHELSGVLNLIHKESDRLQEVMKLLKIFGRHAIFHEDKLTIEGSSKKIEVSIELDMPDDHRMVMVGTLFLLQHGGGRIAPTESVTKSFPGFFDLITFS